MPTKEPIPFSEPPWLLNHPSPYYKETHRKWQRFCRDFVNEHFSEALQWERDGEVPSHVYGKYYGGLCYYRHWLNALSDTFAKHNMMVPNLPAPLPVKWLKSVGIHSVGPIPVEEFDYLHVTIYSAEMIRSGLMGPVTAITTGFAFGVPPIVHFGSPELQKRFLPDLLTGKTRICIAITEPDAGSDVSRSNR
jgi:acyl-CoA dehydrogenase